MITVLISILYFYISWLLIIRYQKNCKIDQQLFCLQEKDEDETSNKDDIEEDEVMDEELDEGTDYANNYFDNGENYLDDEDDNLDEGGIFW